ncbi:MAG: hypothetical protein MZV63_23560 [Marinilabiliales bacterium]|nr:hypothetical protein [Marinilabiliales bacterium]
MSGRSGPTVSDHTPSGPFWNSTVSVRRARSASRQPARDTLLACGAFRRNVTVQSSRTSGEFSGALKGTRFSVFFCGLWSRLMFACWAAADCPRKAAHTEPYRRPAPSHHVTHVLSRSQLAAECARFHHGLSTIGTRGQIPSATRLDPLPKRLHSVVESTRRTPYDPAPARNGEPDDRP